MPTATVFSRIPQVVGDEAGAGGGVVSNVNKGFCRPIDFAPTVRVNGHCIIRDTTTKMWMNCAGPEGPGNTVGTLKYLALMTSASVGPSGETPPGDPSLAAENPAEAGFMESTMAELGGAEGVVGMAQQAYGLATMDWSNPGAVLGALGGVAGLGGLGDVAQAAGLAQRAYGLATTDWSNPGAILGAAMNVAGMTGLDPGSMLSDLLVPSDDDGCFGTGGGSKATPTGRDGRSVPTKLPPGIVLNGGA